MLEKNSLSMKSRLPASLITSSNDVCAHPSEPLSKRTPISDRLYYLEKRFLCDPILPVGQQTKQKRKVQPVSSAHLRSFRYPRVPSNSPGAERQVHGLSAGFSCVRLLPLLLNVSFINPQILSPVFTFRFHARSWRYFCQQGTGAVHSCP